VIQGNLDSIKIPRLSKVKKGGIDSVKNQKDGKVIRYSVDI